MFSLTTRILVVDDSNIYREAMKQLLTELGYTQTVEADDGTTALEILSDARQATIGLVISDWHMKQMSGMDLLLKVREDDKLKKMPFLLVTTEDQMNEVLQAITAGVSDYIVKPVTKDILQKKMASAFAKASKY